ncbi:MAG: hypothetical protein D6776_05295, partial [Planctomycetota bacterium]
MHRTAACHRPARAHSILLAIAIAVFSTAPARAQNLTFPSLPPLPSTEPAAPQLWFSPSEIPAIAARKT